jgi:hypothetical protein
MSDAVPTTDEGATLRKLNQETHEAAHLRNSPNHRHGIAIHSHPEQVGTKHSHGASLSAEATWDVPLWEFTYSPLRFDGEQ